MIFYSEPPKTVSDASFLESSKNAMEKNEISNIEQAYQISLAPSGDSGYTFGQMQWDLAASGNALAVEKFKDILESSGLLDASSIDSIIDIVETYKVSGSSTKLTDVQILNINLVFESDESRQSVNDFYGQ